MPSFGLLRAWFVMSLGHQHLKTVCKISTIKKFTAIFNQECVKGNLFSPPQNSVQQILVEGHYPVTT